jgi:hypothetical protein
MSLELHEILDRYEILYPQIDELADLRRSVIDQDLSSIFRLCDENEELRKAVVEENLHSIFRVLESKSCFEVDDLYNYMEDVRKAVVNKNLRSIFKILGNDNLRKLIIDENIYKLWPILDSYVDTQFTSAFKSFFINNTVIDTDCFSRGQLQSKQWLVNELGKLDVELGTVFLCAGWYATLATMLFESDIKVDKVRSFDIDPTCVDIAETFNKPWFMEQWRFKSITQDIMDIDYDTHKWQSWSNANNRMSRPITDTPDTIINTSCEHIENFAEWYAKIPDGKLVILQSNNFFDVLEHVNCVKDITEFSNMSPMSNTLYAGNLDLPKYKRFMLIGYK